MSSGEPDEGGELSEFEREGIALARKRFGALTGRQKAAQLTSLVVSPNLVGALVYLVFLDALNPENQLAWAVAGVYAFALHPLVYPLALVATGRGDVYVTDRRMRFWPMVNALGGYLVFLAFAGRDLGWDSFPVVFLEASVVLTAVVVVLSPRWKVSIHAAGNAVPFCALAFLSPWTLAFTIPLSLLVAWARWTMRAHTPAQLLAGNLLGFLVPAALVPVLS
ncbi:MAG: hypothetical protein Kow0069_07900 [Promethearchaeota archaeon]